MDPLTLDDKLQLLTNLAQERMVTSDSKLEFADAYSNPKQWGALINQPLLETFNLSEQDLTQTLPDNQSLIALVDELSQTYHQDIQRLSTGLKLHAGKPATVVKEMRTFIVVLVVLLSTDIQFHSGADGVEIDVNYQPTEQLAQSVMKLVSSLTTAGVNKARKNESKDKKGKSNR